EETQTVVFTSGFYVVLLGADESGNPLDDDVFDQWPLHLEVQLEGEEPMSPRMAVGSVPYARQSRVAADLAPGADIEAGSLSVAGTEVVGSDGTWTGPTPAVDWGELTGVPGGFADGDDADTLASTSCGDGELLVYRLSSSSWACGTDTDSTLTSAEVQAMVEAVSGLALAAGSTVGGSAILTAADHGADPDAHHSSTSDGIDITPASVTIQGTSTQLTDGSIDLGSSADDALSASMVQTLTGGGSADALHSHAAVSGGGGGCYVAWGTSTCGTGYTLMYAGYSYTAVENSYSTAGSGSYRLVDGAVGQTKCVDAAATLSGSGPTSGGSASGRVAPIWAAGSSLSNGYIHTLECAMCCG
ncbi:MAG: hypothetical protein VX000_08075, partial [Myxococcota bacterium]|nr:hypothetical protein [Myxococcota bacterium]